MYNQQITAEDLQDELVFKKESILVEIWQRLKRNKLAMFGLITIFIL